MAIHLNEKDSNRFDEMRHVVSVYAADSDHVLRRRFTRLHLYNLYQKHKRLVELDGKLGWLEKTIAESNQNKDEHFRSLHAKPTDELDVLLADIDEKLKDFDSASMLYQRSMQAPQLPTYFIDQLRAAYRTTKQDFYHHYDLESGWSECALHTADEKGVVHRWLDNCIARSSFLQWLFIKNYKEQRGSMLQYSEQAVRRTEDIFINLVFCSLLLAPILILSYVQKKHWQLIVVAVFVLLSTFLSSFMASASHKPGLSIVAGYAAILVVFLSGSQVYDGK